MRHKWTHRKYRHGAWHISSVAAADAAATTSFTIIGTYHKNWAKDKNRWSTNNKGLWRLKNLNIARKEI